MLADFYAQQRNTSKTQEIKNLARCEKVKKNAARHKSHFKKNYGMIRSLLVPDYVIEKMLPIWAALYLLLFIGAVLLLKKNLDQ